MNTDTPLPPEEPVGKNPPDGAIVNYYLRAKAAGPVTLEILDGKGQLVRRYSSSDTPEPVVEKELDVPTYWVRPAQTLSAAAGSHRFVWDLHYAPPPGARRSYPIAAVYRDTASTPLGPWVLPGEYTVRLTVDGRSQTQPLTVKMDPRVKTPAEGLAQQFTLSLQTYEDMRQAGETLRQIRALHTRLQELQPRAKQEELTEALSALDRKAQALAGSGEGAGRRGRGRPARTPEPTLARLQGESGRLLEILQGADAIPTKQTVASCGEVHQAISGLFGRWAELKSSDMKKVNELLGQANLPLLTED
jgi:hypothetical protein